MRFHTTALLLGWGAVLIGVVGVWAQFRRARQFGTEGVSLATWVLFAYMGVFWITYGAVSAHSWEIVLGSLIAFPIQVAIVVRLRPWREWRILALSFAFFLVTCLIPTMLWGWASGVYGIGVTMTLTRTPQIVELIREQHATGVSVNSWLLGAAGSGMWVIYYSGVHLWAPLISTGVAGVASATIALLGAWRHAQARDRGFATDVLTA
ncbi:MAG: hypothetical protein ACYC1I_11315 [Acidimicrobiales bacterium]